MANFEDNAAKIKAGASLLVKGGTLINEPCHKCSGVQVRFADQTTCINCGNVEEMVSAEPKVKAAEMQRSDPATGHLTSASSLIEEKIAMLAYEIKNESDISMQRQKASLIETYLRLLEKIKSLS